MVPGSGFANPAKGEKMNLGYSKVETSNVNSSVANPDSSDPYVFGPLGSGSFYHRANKVRKTLIRTVL